MIVYYYRELEDQIVAKEDDCYFMNASFMNRFTETNKQTVTVTVIWYYYYLFDGTNK